VAQCVVTDRIHFQNECILILCDIRVPATEKAGRDHLAQSGSFDASSSTNQAEKLL
jgi:hypothetical protein